MLRYLLKSNPETLQDFDLAAEEKYWEGFELLAAGHHGCGIYILGYAAEMILKHAAFRVQGHRPGVGLIGLLVPAKRYMKSRRPGVLDESFHSLWFWMHYLRSQRRDSGKLFASDLDAELVRRVRRLYHIWWVEMRYRPDQASAREAQMLYNDVSWLRANRISLWS